MTVADSIGSTFIAHELTSARGLFPYRRYLCVENISWGLLPWEADLVAMSESSGYLTEVEIKISHADLKADFGKTKWRISATLLGPEYRQHHMVRSFYYAVTEDVHRLATKAGTWELAPPHAGVIVARRKTWPKDSTRLDELRCDVVRPAKVNSAARALTTAERYALARLGVMRYWTRCHPGEVDDDNRLPAEITETTSA